MILIKIVFSLQDISESSPLTWKVSFSLYIQTFLTYRFFSCRAINRSRYTAIQRPDVDITAKRFLHVSDIHTLAIFRYVGIIWRTVDFKNVYVETTSCIFF